MPFCSQCGTQVGPADVYCGKCGARQPVGAGAAPPETAPGPEGTPGISARTASILCYIPWVGWIASVIVLASQRFRNDRATRFHAFQGLYLFVAWLIEDRVLRPMFYTISDLHLHGILEAALLAMSIFMMVKAAQDEAYSLPLFGELAERSLSQR